MNCDLIARGPPFRATVEETYKECHSLWRIQNIHALYGQQIDLIEHCVMLHFFRGGTAGKLKTWFWVFTDCSRSLGFPAAGKPVINLLSEEASKNADNLFKERDAI